MNITEFLRTKYSPVMNSTEEQPYTQNISTICLFSLPNDNRQSACLYHSRNRNHRSRVYRRIRNNRRTRPISLIWRREPPRVTEEFIFSEIKGKPSRRMGKQRRKIAPGRVCATCSSEIRGSGSIVSEGDGRNGGSHDLTLPPRRNVEKNFPFRHADRARPPGVFWRPWKRRQRVTFRNDGRKATAPHPA